MLERRLGPTLVLLGALALSACATPSSDSPAAQDSPAASAPSMTSTDSPVAAETPSGQETPSEEPAPAAPTEGAYVDYADGVVEETAGAKVLFFHAPWCPQCRKLDEELLNAGAPDGLTIFKVDYDSRSDLRQKYGVTLQTTVVFVDDTGAPISSTVLYDDPSIASLLAAAP